MIKDAVKAVAGVMVTVGVSAMVKEGSKQLISEDAGSFKRACIWLSLGAITGMICLKVINHVNGEIDDFSVLATDIKSIADGANKKMHILKSEGPTNEQ